MQKGNRNTMQICQCKSLSPWQPFKEVRWRLLLTSLWSTRAIRSSLRCLWYKIIVQSFSYLFVTDRPHDDLSSCWWGPEDDEEWDCGQDPPGNDQQNHLNVRADHIDDDDDPIPPFIILLQLEASRKIRGVQKFKSRKSIVSRLGLELRRDGTHIGVDGAGAYGCDLEWDSDALKVASNFILIRNWIL